MTRLANTRVPFVTLSLLTNALVQTLIVGTHVARAQAVFVHRVLHQVVRATVRFENANATWTIRFEIIDNTVRVRTETRATLLIFHAAALTDKSCLETDVFVYRSKVRHSTDVQELGQIHPLERTRADASVRALFVDVHDTVFLCSLEPRGVPFI